MYVMVEMFLIMGRPLQIIIRIQGIDPCIRMNINRKEEAPKTFLTQAFDRNEPTVINIPVSK